MNVLFLGQAKLLHDPFIGRYPNQRNQGLLMLFSQVIVQKDETKLVSNSNNQFNLFFFPLYICKLRSTLKLMPSPSFFFFYFPKIGHWRAQIMIWINPNNLNDPWSKFWIFYPKRILSMEFSVEKMVIQNM